PATPDRRCRQCSAPRRSTPPGRTRAPPHTTRPRGPVRYGAPTGPAGPPRRGARLPATATPTVPDVHPRRLLAILALAALAFSLAQTMVVPALGTLQRELGTTATGANWSVTAYLLAAAVATPVVGRL